MIIYGLGFIGKYTFAFQIKGEDVLLDFLKIFKYIKSMSIVKHWSVIFVPKILSAENSVAKILSDKVIHIHNLIAYYNAVGRKQCCTECSDSWKRSGG